MLRILSSLWATSAYSPVQEVEQPDKAELLTEAEQAKALGEQKVAA